MVEPFQAGDRVTCVAPTCRDRVYTVERLRWSVNLAAHVDPGHPGHWRVDAVAADGFRIDAPSRLLHLAEPREVCSPAMPQKRADLYIDYPEEI